ncbi:diadenylate cyclase CdaA [Effusibacillus lacus]|uniref:Diadenylate cyclase n=1 Tax=Effusibacillus lacus TaxID=1348429 RepID=A0A292YJ59_9BACL|nr:diadenylate cyclase CdaA [Effusibacillus lacus]TCS68532.1 diadenylate cyclase [Effusibacillus lacus]GAX88414.1 membrane protein [Effusibacillus lacus]
MQTFLDVIGQFKIADALDILIVAFVLYRMILLIRGTRAVQLLKGIVVILIMTGISNYLNLRALNWILDKTLTIGLFAIPVVFQPELRRALEQLGRGGFFSRSFVLAKTQENEEDVRKIINEIAKAASVLSKNKIGALIVIERETGIADIMETGVPIEALVSSELLINIFIPNTPLHDGAVVIRGNRIVTANTFLPLSDDPNLEQELGTRHRAAIGITENSDAIAIVISEEKGFISLTHNGKIIRNIDDQTLRQMLISHLMPQRTGAFSLFGRKAEEK